MSMQEVREAANLVAERFQNATANPNDWLGFLRESEMFAGVILALTDPTPLTVERLMERGAIIDEEKKRLGLDTLMYLGFEIQYPYPEATSWRWWYRGSRQHFTPRTLGELAMLELLMEGR